MLKKLQVRYKSNKIKENKKEKAKATQTSIFDAQTLQDFDLIVEVKQNYLASSRQVLFCLIKKDFEIFVEMPLPS